MADERDKNAPAQLKTKAKAEATTPDANASKPVVAADGDASAVTQQAKSKPKPAPTREAAPRTAAKQSKAKDDTSSEELIVKCNRRKGRWRAGKHFAWGENHFPADTFNEDQLKQIEKDPVLKKEG